MNLEKSFIKNKNKIAIISKGINISYKKIYEDTKTIFKKIDKKKYLILIVQAVIVSFNIKWYLF